MRVGRLVDRTGLIVGRVGRVVGRVVGRGKLVVRQLGDRVIRCVWRVLGRVGRVVDIVVGRVVWRVGRVYG